jgi:hypothetical protein
MMMIILFSWLDVLLIHSFFCDRDQRLGDQVANLGDLSLLVYVLAVNTRLFRRIGTYSRHDSGLCFGRLPKWTKHPRLGGPTLVSLGRIQSALNWAHKLDPADVHQANRKLLLTNDWTGNWTGKLALSAYTPSVSYKYSPPLKG